MIQDPNNVNLPMVNVAFVNGEGKLTEYGRALLNGLRNRTGASDGIDITKLQAFLLQELQSDREAPLSGYAEQPIDPSLQDESPTHIAGSTMQAEDVGIAGLVFELLARLDTAEKRITALENNP